MEVVTTFYSYDGVASWLEGKPRKVGIASAARSALRVIPLLAHKFRLPERELDKTGRDAVLRAFRCAAAAWATAAFPGRVDLVPAAAAASSKLSMGGPGAESASRA
jgi:hypothetical protein